MLDFITNIQYVEKISCQSRTLYLKSFDHSNTWMWGHVFGVLKRTLM